MAVGFLSGGLDSTLTAKLLQEQGGDQGYVLRPLSAGHFKPTIVEIEGSIIAHSRGTDDHVDSARTGQPLMPDFSMAPE